MEFNVKIEENGQITETKVNLKGYTEKDLQKENALYCSCNYLENNPGINSIYVENHLGVNHGWICPSCKKFTQIG